MIAHTEYYMKQKQMKNEQAWFWTERWQHGEKEAEADINEGRVARFPDAKSAVEYLNNGVGGSNPSNAFSKNPLAD